MSAARILVVDDESEIRGLLKEILADEGYEVDVAADAARGARACARSTIRIWCCWTSGCRTPTASRCCANGRSRTARSCPVVMMSGHGTVETAVEATRLGAFDFVEKPLSLAKLLRTVERALDSGRNRRQSRTHAGAAADRACRQEPRDARAARAGPAGRAARDAGADRRRAGHWSRSVRALHPFAEPALCRAVRAAGRDRHQRRGRGGGVARHRRCDGDSRRACSSRRPAVCCSSTASRICRRRRRDLLVAALEAQTFTRVGGATPVKFNVRIISSATPRF